MLLPSCRQVEDHGDLQRVYSKQTSHGRQKGGPLLFPPTPWWRSGQIAFSQDISLHPCPPVERTLLSLAHWKQCGGSAAALSARFPTFHCGVHVAL